MQNSTKVLRERSLSQLVMKHKQLAALVRDKTEEIYLKNLKIRKIQHLFEKF